MRDIKGIVILRNYIKVAFRNMRRHKGVSFINIAGLAVCMACVFTIMLWVRYELSFESKGMPRLYLTILTPLSYQKAWKESFSGAKILSF